MQKIAYKNEAQKTCISCNCHDCGASETNSDIAKSIFGIRNSWLLCTHCYIKRVCTWSIDLINNLINEINIKMKESKVNMKKDVFRKREKSKMLNNLGLNESFAISTDLAISMVNTIRQPLSGVIMEMIILRLQRRIHTPVASISTSDILTDESFIHWKRLKHKFGSKDAENRRDDIYMFPILLGSYLRCNWSLIVLQKRRKNFRGWIFHGSNGIHQAETRRMAANLLKYFNYTNIQEDWTESTISGTRMVESGFWIIKTMCSIGMWNLTRKQNLGAYWIDNASINRMKSICNKSYQKDRDLAADLIKDPVKCWKNLVDSLQKEKIKNNPSINQNKTKKKRKRRKESMSNRKKKNKCIKRSH